MYKQHHIIYVPGLRDTNPLLIPFHKMAISVWRLLGFYPHIYYPRWEEKKSFKTKLDLLVKLVDKLTTDGHLVSLVGQSAGGSMVMNAFSLRKNSLVAAININGRLKAGLKVTPSLEYASKKSPSFKQSVILFEMKNESTLTIKDRQKLLTIRPLWDETVPKGTSEIKGANNRVFPLIEHMLTGGVVTIICPKIFLNFIKKLERN
jgi:hypothetical protein